MTFPSRTLLLAAAFALASPAPRLEAASHSPVRAKNGMVVSGDSLASAAGVEILRRGGNAVDAAVAVGFVLAVTYPEAGNIGGGGFMLIRMSGGESTMIDFREKAPAAAARDMYLDAGGRPVPGKSLLGPLASGVPGTVDGLLTALREYGSLTREEVIGPALKLAQGGFAVSGSLARTIAEEIPRFSLFPATMKAFTRNGKPYRWGDTLRQGDLAATLRAIIDRGAEGFYAGDVASRIVAEMRRDGGIMTAGDLHDYASVERDPLRGTYRGYEILTAPPPSSGGIILLQILNSMERFDCRRMGWNSSASVHLFASACQRAFADRAAYLGDPDFVAVPVEGLIAKSYAARRIADFDSARAQRSTRIGSGVPEDGSHQTTHYCVADRFGNVVSVTITLNGLFGCKAVVDGAGFFLNNEMDDFTAKPGALNMYSLVGGVSNEIAGGKRMLSSMAPTIVVRDNRPFMVLGARGGSRIPTSIAQIICNVIDYGMTIQEAVDAPRVHHQWIPDTLLFERRALQADVVRNLVSMGYVLQEVEATARAQALMIDSGGGWYLGGADPRDDGYAIGY
ncbi:MAG TPA: gamma-glutamyltransferase [Bacteroidota bacterium]|nr:gamma-glutamyltransferase [Bacteroidota bacterium]